MKKKQKYFSVLAAVVLLSIIILGGLAISTPLYASGDTITSTITETSATVAQTPGPLDTPAGMFKILFFATLPFMIGIACGVIALFFKSLKTKKKK